MLILLHTGANERFVLLLFVSTVHKTESTFRKCFAHSKWPHFIGPYLVWVPFLSCIAVYWKSFADVLTFVAICDVVECFIPTALHFANLQAVHFRLVTLSILHFDDHWQVKTWPFSTERLKNDRSFFFSNYSQFSKSSFNLKKEILLL